MTPPVHRPLVSAQRPTAAGSQPAIPAAPQRAALPGPARAVGSPRTLRRGGGVGRDYVKSRDATTQRGAVTHAPLLAQ